MVSAEERGRVLEMIEADKLSVDEATRLLAALEDAPASDAGQPRARWIRLRVTEPASGQVLAAARLPLGAAFLLQRTLGRFLPDLDELDLGGILSSVRGGEGRLLDVVDAQDGHRVEIFFD